jgi:hypothetical protein
MMGSDRGMYSRHTSPSKPEPPYLAIKASSVVSRAWTIWTCIVEEVVLDCVGAGVRRGLEVLKAYCCLGQPA